MFSLDIIIMEYYQHIVRRKMYVEFRAIGTNLAGTFQRTDRVPSGFQYPRWAITFVLSFAATIPAIIRQSSKRRVDFKFMEIKLVDK